jgi:hypothetical protein
MMNVNTDTKSKHARSWASAVLYRVKESLELAASSAEPRIRSRFTSIDPRREA